MYLFGAKAKVTICRQAIVKTGLITDLRPAPGWSAAAPARHTAASAVFRLALAAGGQIRSDLKTTGARNRCRGCGGGWPAAGDCAAAVTAVAVAITTAHTAEPVNSSDDNCNKRVQ